MLTLLPRGLQPTRLLCLWDFPGKNTRVCGRSLLQWNLPDPGMEPVSPALQVGSLTLSHQGSLYALFLFSIVSLSLFF